MLPMETTLSELVLAKMLYLLALVARTGAKEQKNSHRIPGLLLCNSDWLRLKRNVNHSYSSILPLNAELYHLPFALVAVVRSDNFAPTFTTPFTVVKPQTTMTSSLWDAL